MRRHRGRSERPNGRSRGRGDRGAVLIEAAFLLPFLFALLFGIIDFGFVFNDWISVRQGARDGIREAIVNSAPMTPTGGASTTWSCPPGAGAPAVGTDAYALMCFTKQRVGLDQNKTAVSIYFNSTNGWNPGQPVKVCVEYITGSVTGAYNAVLSNKKLDTDVETLIEQQAVNSMSSFQETSFPGGNGPTAFPTSCQQL